MVRFADCLMVGARHLGDPRGRSVPEPGPKSSVDPPAGRTVRRPGAPPSPRSLPIPRPQPRTATCSTPATSLTPSTVRAGRGRSRLRRLLSGRMRRTSARAPRDAAHRRRMHRRAYRLRRKYGICKSCPNKDRSEGIKHRGDRARCRGQHAVRIPGRRSRSGPPATFAHHVCRRCRQSPRRRRREAPAGPVTRNRFRLEPQEREGYGNGKHPPPTIK